MPYGLCNSGATFERLMELILAGLHWSTCLIYVDDIICFSKTVEEHMRRLDEIFCGIREAGLKLAPSKTSLFQQRVSFLGRECVQILRKFKQWKNGPFRAMFTSYASFWERHPTTESFVNLFVTLRGHYTNLQKNKMTVWTAECNQSFSQLKNALTSAPILEYPRNDAQYTLDCDCSSYGMEAVLSQKQDGVERVISYFSKSLTKAERNYCVTRRELLAVVIAVKHYHHYHYLYGTRFIIRTNHSALRWLLTTFKNPEGQISR